MKDKSPKSKILNPWPEQKRKAAQLLIVWDLKTYKAMKKEIEDLQTEIDEAAAPAATDIRESVYTHSKEISFPGGFNTSIIIGHSVHSTNDPTVSKAEAISRYKQTMFAAAEYREMIRRVSAIEKVLGRLEKSTNNEENLKANLIKLKFFEQDKTDAQIAKELNMSRATIYRIQDKIINEIGAELGFIT